MDKRTVHELVNAMKSKDLTAFEEIHRRYEKSLYYMALKLTKNEADAQDMVQETFIQLRISIDSLRNPDVFSLWLKRILYNRCKNMFRKNREFYFDHSMLDALSKEEQTIDYLPEKSMQQNATKDIILSCMKRLSSLYSEPLYLKYYKSMTMEEIGNAMNIPTGTVKSRLRTGKDMLRTEICKYENDNEIKLRLDTNTLGIGFLAALWLKRWTTNFSMGMGVGALSTCVALGGVITVMAMSQLPMFQSNTSRDEINLRAMEQNSSTDIKDEVAYYSLRNWAYLKEDIIKQENVKSMIPHFRLLQEHKGVYWELLQQDEWADTFLSVAQ